MKFHSIFKILPVLILMNTSLYSGARVSFLLKNGNHINGELLVVADNSFVISTIENLNEEKLRINQNQIVLIRKDEVGMFTVCGKSHLLNGIVLGFAAGICIGGLIAYEPRGTAEWGSNYDPYGSGFKTIILFATGCTSLGALTGITASTSDRVLSKAELTSQNYIKKLARYGSEEPEYLTKIN